MGNMACWQALFGMPYRTRGNIPISDGQMEMIKKRFRLKQYDPSVKSQYWPPFYGNYSDEVICVETSGYNSVFYASMTESRFKEIGEIIWSGMF